MIYVRQPRQQTHRKSQRILRFQSTRPAWGATIAPASINTASGISIHAPRVGRDLSNPWRFRRARHFNPRAPRGARLKQQERLRQSRRFQSTRPAWGATPYVVTVDKTTGISIHAPRVGRDSTFKRRSFTSSLFQSTRPRGARRRRRIPPPSLPHFNPRARVGRDMRDRLFRRSAYHFNPRARVGRDVAARAIAILEAFQSTRPRGARRRINGIIHSLMQFQSTRPRGARLRVARLVWLWMDFNPRARVGRDDRRAPSLQLLPISIHAPA